MRISARFRWFRLGSWLVFAASLGAMVAVFAAAVAELGDQTRPGAQGREVAVSTLPAAGEETPAGTPPGVPAGQEARGRSARIALMALGTHPHYRFPHPGKVDLVVVSPERRPVNVLKKARKAHPDAAIFAYLNTMDIMLSRAEEGPSFWKAREEWFLHAGDGERIRVRVRSYKGKQSRYAMNVGHPDYQAWLGDKVVKLFKIGYDGVQLDNVETAYSYKLRYVGRFVSALPVEMTEEKWYASETAMLRRIREIADRAGYIESEIIFNHIRAGEPDRSMQYLAQVDGANAEGWMDRDVDPEGAWGWRSRVSLARRAAKAGKRTNLLCATEGPTREEALFTFASYLMTKESDRNTFWYGKPYRVENMPWFGFYDTDLGWPAGEMREVGGGAFIRPYGRGAVLVNPGASPVAVALDRPLRDELFQEVRSVELPPRSGTLLTVPEGAPPPRWSLEAEACLPAGPGGGGLQRIEDERFSERAAVSLRDTRSSCTLRISLQPGVYRVAVEGRGAGPRGDAVFVAIGEIRRRVAFDRTGRVLFDIHARRAVEQVELRAAEPGVVVDRVHLVRLGDLP